MSFFGNLRLVFKKRKTASRHAFLKPRSGNQLIVKVIVFDNPCTQMTLCVGCHSNPKILPLVDIVSLSCSESKRMLSIKSQLRTVAFLVILMVSSTTLAATVNRLDCTDSEDGETIHCEFALERRAMRKNLDTCIHIGRESFCVEAKIQMLKRILANYDEEL